MASTESGNVTIEIAGVNKTAEIINGVATLNIALPIGNNPIKVYYDGDYYFYPAASVAGNVVVMDKLVSDLRVNDTTLVIGQTTQFGATVNGENSPLITVTVNGQNTDTMYITAGTYNVTATFAGNVSHKANTTSRVFSIAKKSVNIAIVEPELVVGLPATFAATVNGESSGLLKIFIDGVESDTITNVENRLYNVTVTFEGNLTHEAGSVSDLFTPDKEATTISISGTTPVITGLATTITLNPSVSTGKVSINVNGTKYTVDVAEGKEVNITLTAVGNYTVNATYIANGRYLESHSNTIVIEVVPKNVPEITITATKPDSIVVHVNDTASGNVTLYVNGEYVGVKTVQDGRAEFTRELGVGEQNISVTYSGDAEYTAGATASSIAGYDKVASISADNVVAYYNGNGVFTARLYDDNGAVSSKTLIFTINGVDYTAVTNTDGKASIALPLLDIATHAVTIRFKADSDYPSTSATANVTILSTISASDLTRGYGSGYDYQATFLDGDGNKLANSDVQFVVDGKTYTAKTDSNGVASLAAGLGVGTHDVSVVSPSGEVLSKKATIVERIQENKDISLYYNDGTYFTARVYGDDGQPVGAGEQVRFSVHGITYDTRTDAEGRARLKINLAHASYVMDINYKGFSAKNNIVVKNIIKAKKTTTVKKSAKSLKIKITLKGKKVYKKKKVTIKLNNKKYKIKTNNKGVAYFKLTSKTISKLKAGKKYKYRILYYEDHIARYLKVRK